MMMMMYVCLSVRIRSITARIGHHGKAIKTLETGSGRVRKGMGEGTMLCVLFELIKSRLWPEGRKICHGIVRQLCIGDLLRL